MFNLESLAKGMGLDKIAETMREELEKYIKSQEEMNTTLKAILGLLVKIEKRLSDIQAKMEGNE